MQVTHGVMVDMDLGAQVMDGGVRYRVWAPDHTRLAVAIQSDEGERTVALERETDGHFSGFDASGKPGDRYRYRFESGAAFPDPVSRFQPEGVHGPSEVIDPARYGWKTTGWQRPAWRGQSIYELHVGTFTADGTFLSALQHLDHLVALGIEAVELMPVADFGGDRNWGYDGVALYAPARCYGHPDDLRALVDGLHARGILVILDVVYNHTGPNGSYLTQFAGRYYHPTHRTPWGHGFNFDGPECGPVREHFIGNAMYWLDEFGIDGLRLDATHAIEDNSPRHLLTEIAERVHARGGFLVAEDERNSCAVLTPRDQGGHGIDAVWSDDFHHQVRVALTGVKEGYFASYSGTLDALATTLDHGWFYTGQAYAQWKGRPRGTACRELAPRAFVYCIENHDQVGNRALGERLEHLVAPSWFRASSALLCLSPYVPLIFMGQEWAATSPFLYFTNHGGDLGRAVSQGRRREFAEAGINTHLAEEQIPDPEELTTFVRSKLDWRDLGRPEHAAVLALYRACLRVRKEWIQHALDDREHYTVSVAGDVLAVRYEPRDRPAVLVLVALKPARIEHAATFSVLAPAAETTWRCALQTEAGEFGGRAGAIHGTALSPGGTGPWLRFEQAGAVVLVAENL